MNRPKLHSIIMRFLSNAWRFATPETLQPLEAALLGDGSCDPATRVHRVGAFLQLFNSGEAQCAVKGVPVLAAGLDDPTVPIPTTSEPVWVHFGKMSMILFLVRRPRVGGSWVPLLFFDLQVDLV